MSKIKELLEVKVNESMVDIINDKLKSLGFSFKADNATNFTKEIGSTSINPETLGLFKYPFKTIDVLVKAGKTEEAQTADIVLEYSYKHVGGGSNGYNVRFSYRDGKWNDTSF